MVDIYFVRMHGEHNIYLPARWNGFYISIFILNSNTIHDLPIAIYKYTARKTFSKEYENMEWNVI